MTAQTYTVDTVDPRTREWSSQQGGPMVAYSVVFREHPGKWIEWSRKKDSDPPSLGQQVEGTIDWEGKFGARFKQDFSQKGGGGWKPRDPKETAAIQRQHSQGMSLQAVRLAADLGLLPKMENTAALFDAIDRTTDRFQRDIGRGVNLEMYGAKQEPVRRQGVEPTGQSDVPTNGAPEPASVTADKNLDDIPW